MLRKHVCAFTPQCPGKVRNRGKAACSLLAAIDCTTPRRRVIAPCSMECVQMAILQKKLKIQTVTMAATIGVALLALGGGGLALQIIGRIGDSLAYSADNTVPSLAVLGDIAQGAARSRQLMAAHILETTPEGTRRLDAQLVESMHETDAKFASYQALLSDETERAMFAQLLGDWQSWKQAAEPTRQASLSIQTERATSLFQHPPAPAWRSA
ncbi:Tar ligand binding domain-containing protein [Novosphingobium colocasiae]